MVVKDFLLLSEASSRLDANFLEKPQQFTARSRHGACLASLRARDKKQQLNLLKIHCCNERSRSGIKGWCGQHRAWQLEVVTSGQVTSAHDVALSTSCSDLLTPVAPAAPEAFSDQRSWSEWLRSGKFSPLVPRSDATAHEVWPKRP